MTQYTDPERERLQAGIEEVESGYEFLLAYAAQGRDNDGGPTSEVRAILAGMQKAAADVAGLLQQSKDEFAWVVVGDARKTGAAIALVLKQETISSEMVDNLNISMHLRALLADLFLVSEAAG